MVDYSKNAIPEGTIVITRGWEAKMYDLNDLKFMRELEAGQLFSAVARYYNKSSVDYTTAWPKIKTPLGEISRAWKLVERKIAEERTDYDRLVLVCKQLNEVVPDCLLEVTTTNDAA